MDPITIASLIASALASAYSTQQQASATRKIQSQQAAAAQAERIRQSAIDDERAAAVAAKTPDFTPEKQNEEQSTIAGNLEKYLAPTNQRTAAEAEYANASNPGAPKEVNDNRARSLSVALQKGQDYAKNLASVSALKNLNFGNAISIGRLGTTVGELNKQSARSAELLPNELKAAEAAGNAGMTRASAAQGLASIAAMYAATRPAVAAPTPTPPLPQPGGAGLVLGGGTGLKPPGTTLGFDPNIFTAGDPYALNLRL
jgi:hypothetical protein